MSQLLQVQALPCLQNVVQANTKSLRKIWPSQEIVWYLFTAGIHVPSSWILVTISCQKQAAELNRPMVWFTLLILTFGYTNYSEFRLAAKLIRGRKLLTCAAKLGELSSLSHTPTNRYNFTNWLLRKAPNIITCTRSVNFKLRGRIEPPFVPGGITKTNIKSEIIEFFNNMEQNF